MTKTEETHHKPHRKLKLKVTDIVVLGIMLVVVVVLVGTITSKLSLKHDAAAAQVVADKAIADLQKRDGTAAHKLGTKKFQQTYTADQLTKQFKAIEVATLKSPKLDNTTVADGKSGRTVYFIYKYTALKVPYYIRIAIIEKRMSGN
jgi:hypothetical protein